MAAAAKLQAAYRGAAIRRQLARLGDLKGDTLAVRRLGSTPGQVGLGIFSSTAIFVGSREQQDRRARTLASDLGFSEHAVIAAFRARDRDGSGTLSKRELRNALSDLGVKLDRTEISAQLACYDADLDGALGEAEFLRLAQSLVASLEPIAKVFRAYDRDSSGELSKRELRSALHALGIRVSGEGATRHLREYDRDASGSLSLSEFAALARNLAPVAAVEAEKPSAASQLWARVEESIGGETVPSDAPGIMVQPDCLEMSLNDIAARAIKRAMRVNLSTLTAFFAKADIDKSGMIDRHELYHALRSLSLECKQKEVDALFKEMGAGDSGYVDYRNLKHFLMAYGRPTNEAQATLSLWGASEYDAAEVGVDGAQKVENKGASKGKGGKTGNKGKQAAKGKGAPARAGKLSKVAPETKARGAKSEEAMRGPVGVDGPPGLNVTTIKIVVIAEDRSTSTYLVHLTSEPPTALELPKPPVALNGLIGHLIGYYGQVVDAEHLPEPVARARAAGRSLAERAAPGLAHRGATAKRLDASARSRHTAEVSAGQQAGEECISEERFVACCTTLRIATPQIARLAFRQVALRPYVHLNRSRFWEALCFTFIRALSDVPFARKRSAEWEFEPNTLLEIMLDTLIPLSYNISAAVSTSDAHAGLAQQRRAAAAASETEAHAREIYRASSAGRSRPGTPTCIAGRPGALTLEEEAEYLALVDGDDNRSFAGDPNVGFLGLTTCASTPNKSLLTLSPLARSLGGLMACDVGSNPPPPLDAWPLESDDSVLGPGRDRSPTRLDQARAAMRHVGTPMSERPRMMSPSTPLGPPLTRPASAAVYRPLGAFIGSRRVGGSDAAEEDDGSPFALNLPATPPRPMTAPARRNVITPFPTHIKSLQAAPSPPTGSREGGGFRAARSQLGSEAAWARCAFPGDPILERPPKPVRPPLAPPPTALSGDHTKQYMRHMRKVWQEMQPAARSVAESNLAARLSTIEAMKVRDGTSPTLSAHRRLSQTVALYALQAPPPKAAWNGPPAKGAKPGKKKASGPAGKKKAKKT